jgi:hypothetical protein
MRHVTWQILAELVEYTYRRYHNTTLVVTSYILLGLNMITCCQCLCLSMSFDITNNFSIPLFPKTTLKKSSVQSEGFKEMVIRHCFERVIEKDCAF